MWEMIRRRRRAIPLLDTGKAQKKPSLAASFGSSMDRLDHDWIQMSLPFQAEEVNRFRYNKHPKNSPKENEQLSLLDLNKRG